ncbi:MAG: HD domain-containing protein [Acidobacteria bacterium]|nr:HD domain-containing protein [Acidobacteriota bacterium]
MKQGGMTVKKDTKTKENIIHLKSRISRKSDPESATETGQENYLQALIDSFPFYAMLIDEDHNIILVNQLVSNGFGFDPKEIIGTYCPKTIHGLDHPFPGCPLEDALKLDKAVEKELFDSNLQMWSKSGVYPTPFRSRENKKIYFHFAQDITDQKLMQETNLRQSRITDTLNNLLKISLQTIPLVTQLEKILDYVTGITWLTLDSRGGIFLIEGEEKVLKLKVAKNLNPDLLKRCAEVPFGYCLCGKAALSREVEFADCVDHRHDIIYDGIVPHGHYCIPIKKEKRLLGVLVLYLHEGHKKVESEIEFLQAVSDILSGMIIRNETTKQLEATVGKLRTVLGGIIQTIDNLMEIRDPYTSGHQRRVADLARTIAMEMRLPETQVDSIRIAGVLHDIGKMTVPAEILSKPGRLNEFEFNIIKQHPEVGNHILKDIDFPWPIAKIVLQHHEKMNGSGYPSGTKGEEILIEARILAVADVVEAMSSHRPYRPALGIEKALEEITKNKGILFDTDVVDACVALFQEHRYSFKE